ncbi:MAG: T9SS type A sorting domain-containing protein, partial [Dinghuibacter sp.]|nr:T9SS type A sorting domain-containing protein [Dinghuibacter sp.]
SNTTYYWYVTPKGPGGAASGCNANTTSFATGLIYCVPVYSNNICSSGDSLVYFSLKGEDGTQLINASGGSCGATSNNYSNYTAIGSADLYPSKAYSGKLKVNPGFSEGVSMWIDFNDNGLFEGTEKVLNHLTVAPADNELLYSIYIPIGSPAGAHRLRVRSVFGNAGANIDPCASYGFGETEDYTVNILGSSIPPYTVSAPPAPGTCITAGVTTIDSLSNNRNTVVPLIDSLNNIVGSVNALNQNLGRVTTQYYLHNSNNGTTTRQDAVAGAPPTSVYYLDRNLRISVATQPATPVNVRMYLTATDLANYNVSTPATTVGLLNVHKTNQNFCATRAAGDSMYIAQTGSGTLGSDYFVDFISPSFSNFYLYRGTAVLPVTIADIYGRVTGASNTVYWVTAQEQNTRKFVVERSLNGRDFSAIGETPTRAANGNSSTPLHYSFADIAPVTGKSFYRLRMVDNNGRETLSAIITLLRGDGKFEVVDVRPNPTNGQLYFNVIGGSNSNLNIVVRNLNGQVVMRTPVTQGAAFSINLGGLANGVYTLEATNRNGEKAVFKVVKQ